MSKQGATPFYSIRRRTAASAAALALLAGASGAQSAEAGDTAEIFIFGDIGESWDGESVAAKDFVRDIAALDVSHITVRINSYGGSVSDGIAIHNAIKRHPAAVTVTVESIAASIASLIAMAGDRIEIADNALMMVHAPWGMAIGNAVELRDMADMLDTWSGAMSASYAAKTGRPVDEILPWLTDGKDHFFTAEQALAERLADAVTPAVPAMASAASRFDWARRHAAALPATPAPSAAAAAITTEIPNMGQPTNTPAATDHEAAIANARAEGVAAEAKRRADISAEFKPFADRADISGLEAALITNAKADADEARRQILAALARGAEPLGGHYLATIEAEADKRAAGIRGALEARAGLAKPDTKNPFRGYSMVEMARASLGHKGVKTEGLDKMGLIALALTHSSSDFPLLLANVAEKSMMRGYEEAEETFTTWTNRGTLPDFKQAKRVDIGAFASLPQVREGGEYTFGTIGERGETIVLAKYGRRLALTREAIINDDLDGFSRLARKLGRAAIRTVGDLVYAQLTSNPTMSDSVALFHASHGNLLTASAINTAAVDAMRTAMAVQKDVGQTSGALNLNLAYLIVPKALEGTAKVVRDAEFEVTSGAAGTKNNTVPNSQRGTFEVITDARLDAASASNWYGCASAAMHDTVEVAYLDGIDTPTLEQQAGWSVDGVEWKVRMEAGVKALDWKTLAKNPN